MNYSLKLSDKKRFVLIGKAVSGIVICDSRYEALQFIENLDQISEEHKEFAKKAIIAANTFAVVAGDGTDLLRGLDEYIFYSEKFEDFNARFFK